MALLHLSLEEFGRMRVGIFWEAMNAFREKEEQDRRHVGELARGAALRLFNLQLKRSDRISDPRKFWLFPWDDSPDSDSREIARLNSLTDGEREAEVDKFLNRIGKSRPNG